jgi:hypothetical protein
MISHTREFDELCEVGVPQHLATHRLAAYAAPVDGDFFGARIYVDDSGREAVLETRRKVWWHGI